LHHLRLVVLVVLVAVVAVVVHAVAIQQTRR